MLLSDLLNIDNLRMEIQRKFISVRAHPLDSNLRIMNYTHEAAYAGEWTHEQKICRGLIVQHEGYRQDGLVVARPFKKFFNYGEHLVGHEDIPLNEPFTVTSKEDGSLGILYQAPDGPAIATRGSFESDQAAWATNHLRASDCPWAGVEDNLTRLFEIIFPANRIVLDYGDFEGLIHLATIDNETGREVEEPLWEGPRVQGYGFQTLEELQDHLTNEPASNREGFVVTFESGLKVKFKFESYVALHRILTGLSERRIWDHISTGGKIEDFIEAVPDEFFTWVREVDARLRMQWMLHMSGLRDRAAKLHDMNFPTRKDLAIAIAEDPDRGWLFRAYDGQWKQLSDAVWKAIRPEGNRTFRTDDDS